MHKALKKDLEYRKAMRDTETEGEEGIWNIDYNRQPNAFTIKFSTKAV